MESMLEIVVKYIFGEFRTIRGAPASSILIVLGIFAVVWIAMDWRYGGFIANRDGVIANRDAEIRLITVQRDDYKDKLGGASPDQAKARIEALEKANESLSARLSVISKRTKPIYPLEDDEKERLTKVLNEIPKNNRFHLDIFWPQLNGNPRNAHLVAEVFSSAQWDVTVRMFSSISGHGLVFAFNRKWNSDESNRPPEARKLMELLSRARIDWATDTLADVPDGTFAFIVGEPN
jgi:hypothetical protein